MEKWYTLRRTDEKGNFLVYPNGFESPEQAFKKSIILYLEADVIFSIYEETVVNGNKMSKPYIA